jgi:hypothetical protein
MKTVREESIVQIYRKIYKKVIEQVWHTTRNEIHLDMRRQLNGNIWTLVCNKIRNQIP